ncbi:vWA domain-containing protein [Kribbella sp. CWNU-51]
MLTLAALCAAFPWLNGSVAAAAGEFSPVMLVLDSSGSMVARDAGGSGTRMDAAKRAVSTMVDSLPAEAPLGLAIYGAHTGSSGAEKAKGCSDVQVVQPVTAVNKPAIKRAVTGAKASGYTPIGRSLLVAAAQLPKEGQRSIVLVSDGEDTCAPPQPCEVAKQLHKQGVDLHVHTIGFKVNAKAREQLACIAQATGGTYHNADDADTLLGVLGRVTDHALRRYEPVGTPIAGTAASGTAPVMTPGQYVDTLNPVEQRYYSADLREGETAYFSATAVFPRGNPIEDEVLDIAVYGPGGVDCHKSVREQNTSAKQGGSLTTLLTWDGVAEGGSDVDECSKPGRYSFRITRDASEGGTDRVPVELLLRVEPPVVGSKGDQLSGAKVGFAAPPAGAGRVVHGGGSFNEATALNGPGRYTETIYYGEELFYRVKLDWGQGLAYRATFAGRAGAATANVRASLFSPVRAPIDFDTTVYTSVGRVLPFDGKPLATPRVSYLNRTASDDDVQKTAVDGWYYLVVRLSPGDGSVSGGVPVTIDLAVAGDKAEGPKYATSGAETSPTPTPEESASASPSSSTTPAPGGGDEGSGTADDSSSPLPWIIAGAAVILVLVLAVLLVLQRRRKSSQQPPGRLPHQGGPPNQQWG